MPTKKQSKELEFLFHQELLAARETIKKKCNYSESRFDHLVDEHGAIKAARIVLKTHRFLYAVTELSKCGCLELSLEKFITESIYSDLFTEDEKKAARSRLRSCGQLAPY